MEKQKQRKLLWKRRIYPALKAALILLICITMIVPGISATLPVKADAGESSDDSNDSNVTSSGQEDTAAAEPAENPGNDINVTNTPVKNTETKDTDIAVSGTDSETPVPENQDNNIKNETLSENKVTPDDTKEPVREEVPQNNTVSGNNVSENSVPDNTVSGNSVSGNSVSDNTVSGNTVSGNTVSGNTVSENAVEVPFNKSTVIDGIEILVEAPEGVFPEGAVLRVVKIESRDSEIAKAVNRKLEKGKKAKTVAAFDIAVLDKEGNEIQPDTSKGSVKVSFKNVDTREAKTNPRKEMRVFCVEDMSNAEAMNTSVGNNEVSFEAEHFTPYAVVMSEDNGLPVTYAAERTGLVKEITITNKDGSAINGKMSLAGEYKITYKLKTLILESDRTEGSPTVNMERGDTLLLPALPEQLKPNYASIPAEGKTIEWILKNGTAAGTLTVYSDGTSKLFLKEDFDNSKEKITNAEVGFDAKLDESKLDNGYNQEIRFTNPDTTFTVTVEDYAPKPPTVEKSSSIDEADSTITWTIKVKNAKTPITDYGTGENKGYLLLKDTISSNQKFDTTYGLHEGTSAGGGSGSSKIDSGVTFTDTTMEYTGYTNVTPEAETTYTYKTTYEANIFTKGSDAAPTGTKTVKFTNGVKLGENVLDKAVTADHEQSLSKTFGDWLTKTGTPVTPIDGDRGKITWTITVKNDSYKLATLNIYDVCKSNAEGYTLSLNGTPISNMTEGSDASSFTSSYHGSSGTDTKTGKTYDWYYEYTNVPAKATITITYDTYLSNYSDYLKSNHAKPTNEAWMNFSFDYGPGIEPVELKGPAMIVKANMAANIIGKESAGYDPARHEFKWKVTVNANKTELKSAVIKDMVQAGQEYVAKDGDITVTLSSGGTSTYTPDVDTDKKKVSINVEDDLDGITGTFYLYTRLTDSEIAKFANNYTSSGNEYENKVNLTATGINQDASAYKGVTSTVLEKAAGNYDYSTREIPWTITVNKNKMAMTGACIVDDLGANHTELTIDKGVKVNNAEIPQGGSTKPYYTYNNGILKVYLADIGDSDVGTDNAKKNITFYARVQDTHPELLSVGASGTAGTITIPNTASLTTDQYGTAVEKSASRNFNNIVLSKKGTPNSSDNSITYKVEFNQAQRTLPSGLVLKDTLTGSGQEFDVSSISLKKATVDKADGSLTSGAEETYEKRIENTADSSILYLTLPKTNDNTSAYILTYKVYITEDVGANPGKSYGNKIEAVGYISGGAAEAEQSFNANSFASGEASGSIRIKVTKTNTEDEPLEGAVFELYKSGALVGTVISKADGTGIFGGLEKNTTYQLKEVKAPEGYAINENIPAITTGSLGGIKNAALCSVVDELLPPPVNNSVGGGSGGSSGGGGSTAPAVPAAPVAPKPVDANITETPVTPAPKSILLPGEPAPVTDVEIITEITQLVLQPENEVRIERETQLRDRVERIMAADPHFFDNATEEVRSFIMNLLAKGDGNLPGGKRLPKTGGFFGSGIMYAIGALLIAIGSIFLWKNRHSVTKEEETHFEK